MLVALTGALSTEVVESGRFTSLEQAMLASDLEGPNRVRGFGVYNAVATVAGATGALAAAVPQRIREVWAGAPPDERWFLVFVPIAGLGAAMAARLSVAVEHGARVPGAPVTGARSAPLGASRPVRRLTRHGGGRLRRGRPPADRSFLVAPRLAERYGLLRTMVFTHLPSNLLLALIPTAPNLTAAVALLLGRVTLSQMDVPTRQAYVMALVTPEERTAAASVTNSARAITRPAGPVLAGVVQSAALGAPFVVAAVVKSAYDLTLWQWFRRVDVEGTG